MGNKEGQTFMGKKGADIYQKTQYLTVFFVEILTKTEGF